MQRPHRFVQPSEHKTDPQIIAGSITPVIDTGLPACLPCPPPDKPQVQVLEMNIRYLNLFRTVGLIEGTSTLFLFGVAMPLKYAAEMPLAVTLAGSVHGALFVVLVAMSVLAIGKVPIPARMGIACIIGAVFPFGPFIMDARLKKLMKANDQRARKITIQM